MPDLLMDEGKSPILSLAQQAVFEDNMFRKMNAVDTLISSLEDDVSKKIGAFAMKQYLHKEVLSNEDFMRQLQMYARIVDNPETAIEYFGQDYVTHPEFNFDTDFMTKLNHINKQVNHFIGTLIKELAKTEEMGF